MSQHNPTTGGVCVGTVKLQKDLFQFLHLKLILP